MYVLVHSLSSNSPNLQISVSSTFFIVKRYYKRSFHFVKGCFSLTKLFSTMMKNLQTFTQVLRNSIHVQYTSVDLITQITYNRVILDVVNLLIKTLNTNAFSYKIFTLHFVKINPLSGTHELIV